MFCALAVSAPALKDRPKPGEVVGEWLVVEYSGGGIPRPADGMSYTFRPDGTCEFRGSATSPPDLCPYSVDTTVRPAAIDLTLADPKRPVARGIYRVEGDALTLCFGMGADRPTEFQARDTWR